MGGAARGKEATDGISGGRDSSKGYHVSFRPQSSSPPTSTESLGDKDGYSSSGVDSSPAPSFSDIACTPGASGKDRVLAYYSGCHTGNKALCEGVVPGQ